VKAPKGGGGHELRDVRGCMAGSTELAATIMMPMNPMPVIVSAAVVISVTVVRVAGAVMRFHYCEWGYPATGHSRCGTMQSTGFTRAGAAQFADCVPGT